MTTGENPNVPHTSTPPPAGRQPDIHAYGYGTSREDESFGSSYNKRPYRSKAMIFAGIGALLLGFGVAVAINALKGDDDGPADALAPAPVATLPATAEPTPTASAPSQDPTAAPTQDAGPELIAGPDLDVGACIADPYESAEQNPDGSYIVEGYTVVPCNESHYGEVFMQTASRATSYDVDGIIVESEQLCYTGYASYVGRPYQESELYMEPFVPTADAWAEGVRDVTCVVVDPNGPLTTSVRNSGR
jgi:hypothetical protein